MRYIQFENADSHPIAILVKGTAFKRPEIQTAYLHPLMERGIPQSDMIAYSLKYNEDGKASAKFIKEYLDALLPGLDSIGVQHLYVTDANYFKVLTKLAKAEPHYGYVLPCKIAGYEHMDVVLGLNYQQLIYNPELQAKLNLTLDTLASHVNGSYQALGSDILHLAHYPDSLEAIQETLNTLMECPYLSCDIEAFSLRFEEAGIGTIAFGIDEHRGAAFACDYAAHPDKTEAGEYGYFQANQPVRALLRKFFEQYPGKLRWHNAAYDVKVIVYTLWMKDPLDTYGLLKGLDIMTRHFDDTKVIAYLATNSTAGNSLGLKALAHEFAGNWAVEEINDIRRIPKQDLLQYNLVDCLSTNYVYDKHHPTMVKDQQEVLYHTLMLPSLKLIIQMELTGMPMEDIRIAEAKAALEAEANQYLTTIQKSPVIQAFNLLVQQRAMEKANAKLKTKQHPIEKFADVVFNPNSGPQLQQLLYEQMGLPVLDYTDTKQPATGGDTLKKLIHHAKDPAHKEILEALIGYAGVAKILSAFIPAFEKGLIKADGLRYLHGSFNLGGTVSGRLSSSKPNMQQIPSGSAYGKLIKKCFSAPKGWLFGGADFNSLEDYISALTTKDPNKLKVYIEGYDGHCLRAFSYFGDKCPDIQDTVDSINSMKKKYPELRQDSKGPTFALTYQGTWHTLVNNLGFDEEKAKAIEKGYHELYKVSDEYVQQRLAQASRDGYVEVAFGLRVRTPLLKQVIFNGAKMPYEAAAEGRTAGNALGQSYGLLNNRAAVEFMQKVWDSPYRYDIKPVALIHDAIYLLIRDDIAVVEFANRELIKSMRWQELPEIQHDTVKLGAALDIFWPNWANPITLPNDADQATIQTTCKEAKDAYLDQQRKQGSPH